MAAAARAAAAAARAAAATTAVGEGSATAKLQPDPSLRTRLELRRFRRVRCSGLRFRYHIIIPPTTRALVVCSAIPKSPLTKLTFAALFSHGALACHCHTAVVPRAYPDAWRALYRPHGDGAAACSKKNLEQRTPVFAASLSSCQEPSSARHEAVLPTDTSQLSRLESLTRAIKG